jgi:hypothetical protein
MKTTKILTIILLTTLLSAGCTGTTPSKNNIDFKNKTSRQPNPSGNGGEAQNGPQPYESENNADVHETTDDNTESTDCADNNNIDNNAIEAILKTLDIDNNLLEKLLKEKKLSSLVQAYKNKETEQSQALPIGSVCVVVLANQMVSELENGEARINMYKDGSHFDKEVESRLTPVTNRRITIQKFINELENSKEEPEAEKLRNSIVKEIKELENAKGEIASILRELVLLRASRGLFGQL